MAAAGRSRRRVLVYSITAQLVCSALAYTVYRQSQAVVIGVGVAIGVVWLLLLGIFLRMPGLTVAVDPSLAGVESVTRA
jgi:uncharacterized membrane protein